MSQPNPAEAATDIGVDDSPETLGGLVAIGIGVVVLLAFIAFAVLYFV